MKHSDLASLVIRSLHTVEELEQVYELESLIWSPEDAVPVNQTITTVKNGGFLLGAYLTDKLIGFQYSFPGFDGENLYLCSHSLGLHPDYRSLGIGEKLKIAQKQTAIEKGYNLITWTYDPLETVNGNLNLHKLQAVCSTYIKNAYGDMDDNLNAGLPTDRLLVQWWIKDLENQKIKSYDSSISKTIETSSKGKYLVPEQVDITKEENTLYVPVPGNFQEMKQEHFQLALQWREATRQVFTHYLRAGWIVTDLVKDLKQHAYVYRLEKGDRAYGD
ncbi:GNAT family N-acetyltransferase [Metabacillus iocasae]|uniref:GNAT superfamily acetyltransferase n=1 Tax=Priestia iocasae TaxID=2291674 RepID=A0ABS2QYY0_9BACI|nr:GNAT family N-acetyltransferase [Metabacillus iocasae]MBM7704403.1 putative GNAT superfamily acetyltransferase [Metabacillus iocasae]